MTLHPTIKAAFSIGFLVTLLGWGALAYLPGQVDDSFIVFAYAHRMVEHGEIAWNTGDRVEGYSSPLHLLVMAVGVVAGLDLSLGARLFSIACTIGILYLSQRKWMGPDRMWFGILLAAWQPLQQWSTAGLETTFGCWLAVLAWPLVLGNRNEWSSGTLLTILFALTRPEGAAWLILALVRRFFLPWSIGKAEAKVGLGVLGLFAYHLARISYFSAVFPTPFLVKLQGSHDWTAGLGEGARELVSASALLMWVLFSRGFQSWAWMPLGVQALLLINAGGDWMGGARLLLPGLLAGLFATMQQERRNHPSGWVRGVVLLLGIGSFVIEPSRNLGQSAGVRDFFLLRHPVLAFRTPWNLPLLEETAFLVEHVPMHAGALISDVGLPGNLEDVRIWDSGGLTDRLTAEILAGYHPEGLPEGWKKRYADDDDVWCIRYSVGDDGADTTPDWMNNLFPLLFPSTVHGRNLRWRCRPGGTPSPELIQQRWDALLARFPTQDWIRWHAARAYLVTGQTQTALEIARQATWIREPAGWIIFDLDPARYQPDRGWGIYTNSSITSAEMPAHFWRNRKIVLDVEDPGVEGAQVEVEQCGLIQMVWVKARTLVSGPPCDNDDAWTVRFMNDAAGPEVDRNVFVMIAEGTG